MLMEYPTRVRTLPAPMPTMAGAQRSATRPVPAQPDTARLLGRFAPISLVHMDGVALQDRIDTKHVLHVDHLYSALASLTEHYRILEIDGVRLHRYQTLYFDTADFALYRQHHAGRRNRYKVRNRHYLDTGLSCLEVKLKTKGDRTIKRRPRTPEIVTELTPETCAFLAEHLPPDTPGLEPQLWNNFARITLVSTRRQERLTLDVDLRFTGGDTVLLPGIAVAEVKQAGRGCSSDFVRVMRGSHIRSTGFSKYCLGVSLLYPDVKHNNSKAHQRLLRKLVQGGSRDPR